MADLVTIFNRIENSLYVSRDSYDVDEFVYDWEDATSPLPPELIYE